MAFTVKDWRDTPDADGNSSTNPVKAAALEDLETRLGAYVDSENTTKVTSTVASAAALTLPATNSDVYTISGTTSITSVVATGHTGRVVTLIFSGILTFTDGSNLKLAGDFTTTADDTITIACDGTNWYEVARSVN